MNNITALLSLLMQSGLIPAAIPSALFIFATLVTLDPILHLLSSIQYQDIGDPLIIFGLIIIAPVIILSYTLTALNPFILKLLQGYVIIPPVRFLYKKSRDFHIYKANKLKTQRENIRSRILHIEENHSNDELKLELEYLKDEYYQIVATYNLYYPEDLSSILPTRFGNILKAAENYAGERYGFDGAHFWPRFVPVIPKDYKSSLENTRDQLSFHVNMAILSINFSLLCLLAIFHYFSMLGSGKIISLAVSNTHLEVLFIFVLAAATGFVTCYFFYNASVLSALDFSLIIRSYSDLFRLDLLEKLGLEKPKDSIEEFNTWQKVNELIVLGSHSLTFTKLDYRTETKPNDRSPNETDHEQDINLAHILETLGLFLQKNNSKIEINSNEFIDKFSLSIEKNDKVMDVTEEFYGMLAEYTRNLKTFMSNNRKTYPKKNRNV